MAILISDKVDFRANNITRDKRRPLHNDGHQEDITILNICAPCGKASQVHKVKIDWTAKKTRLIHSYSWGFQDPSLNNLLRQVDRKPGKI